MNSSKISPEALLGSLWNKEVCGVGKAVASDRGPDGCMRSASAWDQQVVPRPLEQVSWCCLDHSSRLESSGFTDNWKTSDTKDQCVLFNSSLYFWRIFYNYSTSFFRFFPPTPPIYLSLLTFKFTDSFSVCCYIWCVHAFMCVPTYISTTCSVWIMLCAFFLGDEHLELNNQLECSSQRTIISPTLSVPYLSVDLV